MALDAKLKRELEEARQNIKTQLDEIEYPRGGWGPRRADFRGVHAELQDELRQIEELLNSDTDEA